MKKTVSLFLFIFFFSGAGDVHAKLSSDQIKIGVSGAASLVCALGSWYSFKQAKKILEYQAFVFDDIEELGSRRRFYRRLGYVLAAGFIGSGAYCGYKVYGLCGKPRDDMRSFVLEAFDGLKRENNSGQYKNLYKEYEQNVLPIVERHVQDGVGVWLKDGVTECFVNCYRECISKIENTVLNDPNKSHDEGDTMGGMLKDHLYSLLNRYWPVGEYGVLNKEIEKFKNEYEQVVQAVEGDDFLPDRSNWIDGLLLLLRDLEFKRTEQI
ncbi:hypothetical protein KKA53_04115 [Candidatus Dependentiae bacterium]|nr:hypothetical protein [Candidatus Dependentiae bacterium]